MDSVGKGVHIGGTALRAVLQESFPKHGPEAHATICLFSLVIIMCMQVIDLTHRFDAAMPVYPGDPHSTLRQIADIKSSGFTDHELHTAMHVGTHIDAPLHMIPGGKYLSEISIEKFIGRGHLIDARKCTKEIPVELLDSRTIEKDDILLVMTGFSKRYTEKDYYESYPELSSAFAEKAAELGIKMIGMDIPSPDRPPFPVHKILLKKEILIMENLTNLEALVSVERFTVFALPIKLLADAAPARVIAIVTEL